MKLTNHNKYHGRKYIHNTIHEELWTMTTRSDPVKVNWGIRKRTSRNLTNTLIVLCVGITGVRGRKVQLEEPYLVEQQNQINRKCMLRN